MSKNLKTEMFINLKTNPELDEEFAKVQEMVESMPVPKNISTIYDFAKRFFNQHGLGVHFIAEIYLLGYIDGLKRLRKYML